MCQFFLFYDLYKISFKVYSMFFQIHFFIHHSSIETQICYTIFFNDKKLKDKLLMLQMVHI